MRVAVDRGAAALLVAAIAIAAPPVRAAPLESPAPLERVPAHATLNTTAKGELFAWRDDECLWVAAEDLARVGVPSEGASMREIEGRPHACVGRLEGVEAVLDEATLTIAFTVDPKRLETQSFDLSRAEVLEITPSKGVSGYLNYYLEADRSDGASTYSGRLLANLAAGGWLARTEHQANESAGVTQNFRIQSFVQRDWPTEMLRFIGGDFDTRSGPLSRSYSLGGISFGRAFDLHPGLVTSPTAQLRGIAASASTAEIFVDGVRVATQALQPGPYDFRNLQDFSGLRNVEVVIRDASGVRERLRVPFYFTERLLSKGLTDFNVSWGAERSSSLDSYGAGTFSAFLFHGVTDRLTLGVEAQRSSGYGYGAFAAGFRTDWAGVFSGQVGAQRLGDAPAALAGTFAWNYTRGGTTLRALARGYEAGYDSPALIGPIAPENLIVAAPRLKRETTVGWDQSLGWTLMLSLSATDRRYHNALPQRDYGVSLSAGFFGIGSLIASVLRTCVVESVCTNQAGASFSVTFGDPYGASTGWRRDADGSDTTYVQAYRSVPLGEGYGWRADAQQTPQSREVQADATLRLRHGVITAGARGARFDDGGRSEAYRAGLEGALACVGASCYVTQPVTDSFAIVELNGVEGVRVSRNNEKIGSTSATGEVLIPNVPVLTRNDIAIADEDVPISISVPFNRQVLVPAQGVGYRVRFDLRPIMSVVGKLVRDRDGARVEVENVELIVRSERTEPQQTRTGKGGFFQLDQIEAGRYHLSADLEDGPCGVHLEIPPERTPVLRLGEVKCEIAAQF
jgi:outer membrane usher protein